MYLWGEHMVEENGSKEAFIFNPIRIPFKEQVLMVSCGFDHTLILSDHYPYAFGKNNHGQLAEP
jgi:alpha-tubulin suppressor-like RCC1 family protein